MVTNIDLAFYEEYPIINKHSTPAQRVEHGQWTHSNRVCLMVIKYNMEKTIRQSVVDTQNVKAFLELVLEKYVKFEKAEKGHHLSLLEKTIYDGMSGNQKHIMKLAHYFNRLKSMNVDLGDSFLIW